MMINAAKLFFIILIMSGAISVVEAEPCECGPVEDISLIPQNPTRNDVLTARAAIRDFNIVFQEAAILDVDLENNIIDLTLITTDVVGDDVDQVQFYPIGQLPSGIYTFNLFIGGLNPPPPLPPGPQLVYTTTVEVAGIAARPVPDLNHWGRMLLLVMIASAGGFFLRKAAE